MPMCLSNSQLESQDDDSMSMCLSNSQDDDSMSNSQDDDSMSMCLSNSHGTGRVRAGSSKRACACRSCMLAG